MAFWLVEEATHDMREFLQGTQRADGEAFEVRHVLHAAACDVALDVAPDGFVGVQVRGVGRQREALESAVGAGDRFLHQLGGKTAAVTEPSCAS